MVSRVLRLTLAILLLSTVGVAAVQPDLAAEEKQQKEKVEKKHGDVLTDAPDNDTQIEQLRYALIRLPIAAGLASVLAFRPRRRGTPPRESAVIHTQIILAVVGASVMLVVGSSLARAFGIVGAAGLVRYRAKIDDPKDAVVMLSTLSIGLCCGVELYGLALFATVFLLGVLWAVESIEPEMTKHFELKVSTDDPPALRNEVESILRRYHVKFELRTLGQKEIVYD